MISREILLEGAKEFFISQDREDGTWVAGWRVYPNYPLHTILKRGTWQECVDRIAELDKAGWK